MKNNLRYVLSNPEIADEMGKHAGLLRESYCPEKVLGEWEKYLNLL